MVVSVLRPPERQGSTWQILRIGAGYMKRRNSSRSGLNLGGLAERYSLPLLPTGQADMAEANSSAESV